MLIFLEMPLKRFVFKNQFKKKRQEFVQKKTAAEQLISKGKLKKVSETATNTNLFSSEIIVGNIVEHNRFGKGEVLALEGKGPNKKAEIQFGTVGKKKLLLQFAKLKVIG